MEGKGRKWEKKWTVSAHIIILRDLPPSAHVNSIWENCSHIRMSMTDQSESLIGIIRDVLREVKVCCC